MRAEAAGTVGVLSRGGQVEEAQLPDLHAGVEQDRHRRRVRQLQSHVAREAGVNEARRRVGEQAKAAKGGLALKARGNVVAEGHQLVGGAQDELAGVQHEGLIGAHVDLMSEVRLVRRRVNHRVAVVIEESEQAIQAHVDTGRLDQVPVERVELDTSRIQRGLDVAVTEQHDSIVAYSAPRQQPQGITAGADPERRMRTSPSER